MHSAIPAMRGLQSNIARPMVCWATSCGYQPRPTAYCVQYAPSQ